MSVATPIVKRKAAPAAWLVTLAALAGTLPACDRGPTVPLPARPAPDDTAHAWTYTPNDTTDSVDQQLEHRHEDAAHVAELVEIPAGSTVADIGCGGGYYVPMLAEGVGRRGTVYALDVKPELVEGLRARLDADRALDPHRVVEPYVNAIHDAQLPPDAVDVGFMAHVDFPLYQPLPPSQVAMLESCFRAIRPGGRLYVLQWMGVPPAFRSPDGAMRAGTRLNLVANLEAAGFVEEAAHEIRPPPVPQRVDGVWQPLRDRSDTWLLVFRKPDAGEPR